MTSRAHRLPNARQRRFEALETRACPAAVLDCGDELLAEAGRTERCSVLRTVEPGPCAAAICQPQAADLQIAACDEQESGEQVDAALLEMLRTEDGGHLSGNGNLQIADLTSVAIDPQSAADRLGPFYQFQSSRLRTAESESLFLLPGGSGQRDLFLANSSSPASADQTLHLVVKFRGNQGLRDELF